MALSFRWPPTCLQYYHKNKSEHLIPNNIETIVNSSTILYNVTIFALPMVPPVKSIIPSTTGFLLYTTFSDVGRWLPNGTVSITGRGDESEGTVMTALLQNCRL